MFYKKITSSEIAHFRDLLCKQFQGPVLSGANVSCAVITEKWTVCLEVERAVTQRQHCFFISLLFH